MKILFLSRWFPEPSDNGSKLRILNLLRGLAKHHEVTLLSFSDQPEASQEAKQIRSLCSDVHIVQWREFDPRSARAALGFFSLSPRWLIDTFSQEMADEIRRQLNGKKYDLVIASQLPMAAYYPYFKDVPAIFEEMELGLYVDDLQRPAGWLQRIRRRFAWFKLRLYLSRLLKHIRAVTVVSDAERELAVSNFPQMKKITVIPNGMEIVADAEIARTPKPNTMIFTGSFRYSVNYEAMVWFVSKAFPLILNKIPDAELIVTGDHLDLPLPSEKNIRRTGRVDDIRRWIANSAVALAPLWSGGGTRLKVLEAMALGVPVVATSKGAEGLGAHGGEHLFLADSPEEFAGRVIELMQDRALADRIASNARGFVNENFDWNIVMPKFLQVAEQAGRK